MQRAFMQEPMHWRAVLSQTDTSSIDATFDEGENVRASSVPTVAQLAEEEGMEGTVRNEVLTTGLAISPASYWSSVKELAFGIRLPDPPEGNVGRFRGALDVRRRASVQRWLRELSMGLEHRAVLTTNAMPVSTPDVLLWSLGAPAGVEPVTERLWIFVGEIKATFERVFGRRIHIYTLDDGAFVVDVVLDQGRVACVLRRDYAHLMYLLGDKMDEIVLFGDDATPKKVEEELEAMMR